MCVCYFERTLTDIHPPFVVSVTVLIINIHRSVVKGADMDSNQSQSSILLFKI